jgi:hypothetical protein
LLLWGFVRLDRAQDRGESTERWAALAGFGLGMLAITRSLTAVVVALPCGILLLVRALRRPRAIPQLVKAYWPFVVIAALITALQPLYLYIVTGSPTTNLYTMVWKYDRVGFGPEFGRSGHTLDDGLYTTAKDLELWTSEMFGWRYASWVPLIPGLIGGVRMAKSGGKFWPLVLIGPMILLPVAYTAYWVGARVYGPRYYYEALAGVVIVAALGLQSIVNGAIRAFLRLRGQWPISEAQIRRVAGPGLYLVLAGLLAVSALTYLPDRLAEWRGMYGITREPLRELDKVRRTDRVLLIVRGGRWIEYAPFFYLNSPWYDGPIVATHDHDLNRVERLKVIYAGREVLFYWNGEFSREPFPYDEQD